MSAAEIIPGADPGRGRELITQYGCGTCHTIPGVMGAAGVVGPPLTKLALRSYLAGRLQNTPDNLIMWIHNPKQVDEKTAMPNTGVSQDDARQIARYLYTLK